MKITVLANDYTNGACPAEHGLSLFVEFNGKKILVDAGPGDTFLSNSLKLGIDLSKVDFIIITHGHYDHTSGFKKFQFGGQKVFVHKNAFKDRYRLLPEGYDFNGIKWNEKNLAGKTNFILNEKFVEIDKGVFLSGTIPRAKGTPKNNFFEKINGEYLPDIVEDEQLIVFKEKDGLVVVSGCTHFGIENMTDFIKQKFPNQKVKALFAGLHLSKQNDENLEKTIKYFSDNDIYQKIYSLHCTGEKAGRMIEEKLNGKLVSVSETIDTSKIETKEKIS